jgi:hypothetical protein
MRWGALLVGCVVAACGGGTGVDIEIAAPTGVPVDRVELWVAYDQCYDCPNGIAWTQDDRASGDIYFLRDEGLIQAEPRGDTFVLHLDAAQGNADPPWVAIVGYDKDKASAVRVLHDVHIPSTKVVVWKVDLYPAAPASTDVATAPKDAAIDHRAHVWNRAPTPELPAPTGCLAYQKWTGSEWETEYFVPKTDPDCDGVPPEKECSEFWYQYKPFGRCVTDAGTTLPGACIIGNSPCADGVSSDSTCREEPAKPITCLPDAVCAKCAGEIPADFCAPSAIDDAITNDTTFHYHCGFDATAEGTACQQILQKVTLRAPMLSATCASPLMHFVDDPFGNPQSSLVFGTAPNVAKFTAHATTEPCVFDVTWEAGTVQAFIGNVSFLLEVPYTNGTRALYPVQITPTNQTITCALPPPVHECLPGGPIDDGVAACATY